MAQYLYLSDHLAGDEEVGEGGKLADSLFNVLFCCGLFRVALFCFSLHSFVFCMIVSFCIDVFRFMTTLMSRDTGHGGALLGRAAAAAAATAAAAAAAAAAS